MKTQYIIILLVAIAAIYFFVLRGKKEPETTTDTRPAPVPLVRASVKTDSGRVPLPNGVLSGRSFVDRNEAANYYRSKGGAGAGCSFVELAGGGFSVEGC